MSGGDTNLRSYASNAPTDFVDPSGTKGNLVNLAKKVHAGVKKVQAVKKKIEKYEQEGVLKFYYYKGVLAGIGVNSPAGPTRQQFFEVCVDGLQPGVPVEAAGKAASAFGPEIENLVKKAAGKGATYIPKASAGLQVENPNEPIYRSHGIIYIPMEWLQKSLQAAGGWLSLQGKIFQNGAKIVTSTLSTPVKKININSIVAPAGSYAKSKVTGMITSNNTQPLLAQILAGPLPSGGSGFSGNINNVSTGVTSTSPQDQDNQTTTTGTLGNYQGGGYDSAAQIAELVCTAAVIQAPSYAEGVVNALVTAAESRR